MMRSHAGPLRGEVQWLAPMKCMGPATVCILAQTIMEEEEEEEEVKHMHYYYTNQQSRENRIK